MIALRWWQRRRLLCPEVARLLQRYLDEELPDVRAAQVRRHLRSCRRCGLQAELYTEVKAAVRRRSDPLPAEAVDRLRAFADDLVRGEEPGPPSNGGDARDA